MGTSASSMGPGAGASLDPEWLDDIKLPSQDNEQPDYRNDGDSENDNQSDEKEPDDDEKLAIAPKFRFTSARRGMGKYVHSGSKDPLRKSLGHYSKTGMGRAKDLSKRMRTSARAAANFFQTFRSLGDDENFPLGRILSELQGRGVNANEVIDIIIGNVCPAGGSLDEVSCRDSGRFALSEFVSRNLDTDISKLTDDQIWSLAGTFLGNEAPSRVQLDIGQTFEGREVSAVGRVNRMSEVEGYLRSKTSLQLNRLRNSGSKTIDMQKLFQTAVKNTFEVYEVEV